MRNNNHHKLIVGRFCNPYSILHFPSSAQNNFFNPLTDKNCSYHPQGPLIRLDLPDKKTTKEELEAQDNNFWQPLQQKLKEEKPQDLRTKRILLEYSNAKTSLGILLGAIVGDQAALEAYRQAYEISNYNGTTAHFAAEIYLANNDFQQAWDWEQKAIKAEPTLAEPYNNLGVLALRLKQDKKAAISYFRKYLSLAITSNEKQRVLKDRMLLIGQNLVDIREDLYPEISGIKLEIEKTKKELEKTKETLDRAISEIGKMARKDE